LSKLLLIDGNSILNRAFYGIMGTNMLKTADGTFTNAVYGFLAIMFKILDDLNPEYMCVTFDLKAPTARHKMYEGYKATRKGMPNELAEQMPLIKEVLNAMNIKIIEKEGYEADDVIGTLSQKGQAEGIDVVILSGDRDTFQLTSDHIIVRIPRTKAGKTEVEDFGREKILEVYGVEPKQLIEVKGLMGDTSDNIPGVPGVGEKTALNLIKEYKTIENLYKNLEEGTDTVKGKLRERLVENKELALLSKTLGTINIEVPIEETIEEFQTKEWDKQKVLELFEKLRFNRYIQRFNLKEEKEVRDFKNLLDIIEPNEKEIKELMENIKTEKELVYYIGQKDLQESIIGKVIANIAVYSKEKVYYIDNVDTIVNNFKDIFEDQQIKKCGYKQKKDYILLKEKGINLENLSYDPEIAGYILDPTKSKYTLEDMSIEFLDLSIDEYIESLDLKKQEKQSQMTLFEETNTQEIDETQKYMSSIYAYVIHQLKTKTLEKIKETNQLELFRNIEMPTSQVLADMQYNGIYIDRQELVDYGIILKEKIEILTKEIVELAGEEFNINSPKQLGEVLFEKLNLPVKKKTKSGYSTDVDVLEKLRSEHPIIEKILEYRQLMKLNSTYVEGMIPYISQNTNRIHSYFHQTVTATGRISSTEPNLQNIPTRFELGKKLREVFKPEQGYVFIDADYSQIELRVLSHISNDETMIEAFEHNEDIHAWTASRVFNIPLEEVSKEKRSEAKAVNFGIVYGISDFGLSEQLGISRKQAKQYIEQYLEKYHGIREFMTNITEQAKETGYVETIFKRRRYIPELKSNNYMVRQFGARAAMNTPIQGTAADIMKIAMIDIYNKLKENNMKSKLILQIHDELLIETATEEKEQVKQMLKESMENACKLNVPLLVELSEANNWYEAK